MSRRKEKLEASLKGLFSSAKQRVSPQKPALVPESQATTPPTSERDEFIEKSLFEKPEEMPVIASEPKARSITPGQVSDLRPAEEEVIPEAVTAAPAVTRPPETLAVQLPTTFTAPALAEMQHAEAKIKNGISSIEFLAKESTQTIIFMLRGDYYGINISNVRTVIKPQPACPVPHTADFLIGLINLRGQVVPVVDLRKRLNFPTAEICKDTRVIIVSVRNELAGILVDAVIGVKALPNDSIEPPSPIFTTTDINLFTGIAKVEGKVILLLDLVKLFFPEQMEKHSTELVFY